MIWIIAMLLLAAWWFGLTISLSLGGWIHFLVPAAISLISMGIIQARKTPVWLFLSPRRMNNAEIFSPYPRMRE